MFRLSEHIVVFLLFDAKLFLSFPFYFIGGGIDGLSFNLNDFIDLSSCCVSELVICFHSHGGIGNVPLIVRRRTPGTSGP